MKKKIYNKISVKLILLVAIAFLVSIVTFGAIANIFTNYMINNYGNRENVPITTAYKIYSGTIISLPFIIFLIIFLTGVNKRIKYLRYIIDGVKEIKDQSYLEELDVKGKDEIGELAESINIMSNRLKENYRKEKEIEDAKNELIVAVSHDLKTPLTSIIGYLELINKNIDNYNKEDKEYIEIVYKKSLSLKKLIEELFEYTKLNSGYVTLEKTKFNIGILINQVVGEYIPLLKNKSIRTEIKSNSGELWCEIDVEKMVRVIDNIVRNAEKYSFPDTDFKVSIVQLEDSIKITFQNVGDNIDEKQLKKVFEKMYRLDKARASENEGSGLGLAISKRIIELHGGELWAECEGNNIKFNMLLKKYSL
ncbi:sensor histidine kinase [Dethiothermospora halolimnae]|uniref:sensor histidine kinase n=1 Tax=Dethiothermospora halolimnae TaxID=3114390 RepID=UPI003CCC3D1D